MRKKIFLAIVAVFLMLSLKSYSQVSHTIDSNEIKASVPELFKFHDVIYQIWHEAYPNKDIKALKGFTADIKTGMEKINAAALPGILRDKETKWKEGLGVFNQSAEGYYKAAEGTDDQAMLDAAEKLHANFEMMVRVINPVNKEVDEYHKVLYVIYHKFLPEKNFDGIKSVIDDLVTKAEAVTKTALSKRVESKKDSFDKAAGELVVTTKALKETLNGNDPPAIIKAIEKMHTSYQTLESVFD